MRPVTLVALRLATFDLRRYLIGGLLWMPAHVVPIASGLILRQLFDHLAVMPVSLWLCAAFVAIELVRGVSIVIAWAYGVYWWNTAATLLRANVLRSLLTAGGPAASRLPSTSGESVSRLRDDVSDVVELVDESVPLAGGVLFGGVALMIMASIDPVITLVLVVPMIAVAVLGRLMRELIRRRHQRARELGAAVTAYIGEMFGGVLAIKTAGAEDAAMERLREHNRRRKDAAIKDRLVTDLMETATGATIEISIGLVLLLAAASMRRGDFTVGDLALFTSYVGWLTGLPRTIGMILSRMPQAAVATERLTRLMAAHESADELSRSSHTIAPARETGDALEVLQARGLTVRGRVHAVDLTLQRGSFTVITGAVGSGKTTLVRALLGLLPVDDGTITWNGERIDDPGTFLVPGRAAYASQVPRLFSATLRENLLLGWPDDHLERAVELAAFEMDLETVVGPRGVRLSGGQVQRATAARALVRTPELLVVDDLSSALDVETEKLLWDRIADHGPQTVLVVSHRQAALERADQIIVLDRGMVAGRGSLDDLLETCAEMRRLCANGLLRIG